MKISHYWRRGLTALSVFLILGGCGGTGDGAGVETGPSADAEAGVTTGKVGVMLTDWPTDDYDAFDATIERIELLGDDGHIVLFPREGEAATTVNFLELESFSELLTVADDVPAGVYHKIRLILDRLQLKKGEEAIPVRLPGNGKVDLLARQGIVVAPGTTLLVELDVDVEKSLKMTRTASGHGMVMRPVIFVSTSAEGPGSKLARIFGRVDWIEVNEGRFGLCQEERVSDAHERSDHEEHDEDCLTVHVLTDTGIFDETGEPTDLAMVGPGDLLTAIGSLRVVEEEHDEEEVEAGEQEEDGNESESESEHEEDGGTGPDNEGDGESEAEQEKGGSEDESSYDDDLLLEAHVIELGDLGMFRRLKGEITANYDDAKHEFGLMVQSGQGFTEGTTVTGIVQEGTRIFDKAANPLDTSALTMGVHGHFDGVLMLSDTNGDTLKTALIVLDTEVPGGETIAGEITSVDPEGRSLMLMTDGDALARSAASRCVSVPDETEIVVVTLTDTETVTGDAELSALQPGWPAEVFGEEGVDGCFVAETIRAEDDQRTPEPPGGDPAPVNNAPVADAGADQAVTTGTSVMLDGSGSFDADGDTLGYSWSLSTPEGSTATLDDPTLFNPAFTTDVDGEYLAELVVNDGIEDSVPDSVVVSATTPASTPPANSPPTAFAGNDTTVTTGETVMLDGSASADPDGDLLSFLWTLTPPAGSNALLDDATSATPRFTTDVDGDYIVDLVVNDGSVDSEPDRAVITARGATSSGPDGAALYAEFCAHCHNDLEVSEKRGATAEEIQNAIDNNTGGMGSLMLTLLTPEDVQAIADALAEPL